MYQLRGSWEQAGIARVILDKVDFKAKLIRTDKKVTTHK
jgi:hypothetical protein